MVHFVGSETWFVKESKMAVDHPHGGGESSPTEILIDKIVTSAKKYGELILQMASVEGDVRTGGFFALFDADGNELRVWQEGMCAEDAGLRFRANAQNKCLAMFQHQVVCSGIVASPAMIPPIFDGGIQLENGWYLAFSGLPAVYDRIFCILVGADVALLQMPGLRLNTILRLGPNEELVRGLLQTAFWYALQVEYEVAKSRLAV